MMDLLASDDVWRTRPCTSYLLIIAEQNDPSNWSWVPPALRNARQGFFEFKLI